MKTAKFRKIHYFLNCGPFWCPVFKAFCR